MTTPTIKYLSFDDVVSYLKPMLEQAKRKPLFSPGPATDQNMQKLSPGEIVFLSVGGGAGLSYEGAFDRVFIGARVIGKQGNYGSAESLALHVDRFLLMRDGSGMIGDTYALRVARAGGSPQLAERDRADRYHFQCSYIAEPETGL